MPKRINIGVCVSKQSSLFPLVRWINLQVNMKAWKVWEDSIDNINKNDIIFQDEEPVSGGSTAVINSYFSRGGIVVQLFSLDDEVDFEYVIKDGKLADEKYAKIVENVDLEKVVDGGDGFHVKIVNNDNDDGMFLSFTRNIFSEEIIDPRHAMVVINEEDGTETERDLDVANPAENLKLLINLIKYIASFLEESNVKVEERLPAHRIAIYIHGRSLWLDGWDVSIEDITRAVFAKLGIDELHDELFKRPEFRNIDPDLVPFFPDVYYYHQTFSHDDSVEENRHAIDFLNQARKIHATIRTERNWDLEVTPLFFYDVATMARGEKMWHDKIFLYPPSTIGGKSRGMNHKLLQKCLLEPLARNHLDSHLISPSKDGVEITKFTKPAGQIKERVLDDDARILIIHGTTLVERVPGETTEHFLERDEVKEIGEVDGPSLKVLVYINIDKRRVQQRIKDYGFQMKKVDDRARERLKRSSRRLQEKLHAYTTVSRDRKVFEEHGFKLIGIEDGWDTEQFIKVFLIDQVLPYVWKKRVSRIHHLLPRPLEEYLISLVKPLLPGENVVKLEIGTGSGIDSGGVS
ncbi:MAG: hypothetical protein ACTSUE_21720 [Promethearchaeota archaeon]